MRAYLLLAAVGLALSSLTGCSKEEAPPTPAALEAATDTPVEAVEAAAAALRKGDVLATLRLAMPPAEYDRMKADWVAARSAAVNAQKDSDYAEMMTQLASSDAEQQIYAELEPKLAELEEKIGTQLPDMIDGFKGFAAQGIAANEKLTADEKRNATEMLRAIAEWLKTMPWADREVLKKAIARAVAAAREIDLPTMDAVRALEFEPAMRKAGIAFTGTKDIMAMYGLSLDEVLGSVRAEQLSVEGDIAQVRMSFKLFGQDVSHDIELRRENGRWYGKDTLDKINAARAELEAP